MAVSDREKWDKRYSSDRGNLTPSALLATNINQASVGRALDIACGNGRNSIFLADIGYTVDAIDISSVAIKKLIQQNPAINATCQDIDHFTPQTDCYDLIVNANFLDRRLFPLIEKGLKTGGLLVFESFAGKTTSKYCLGPNELLHAFTSLHVIFYAENDLQDSDKFDTSISFVAIKKA